jgi:molybdopterin/thiamine biosynthesis adenylyltransferase/rhodanese-related sulfurtransferase
VNTTTYNGQLSAEELSRYSRHLVLPQVGAAGQMRLKQSSVLIVGAGGLGSPASLYLAAAGVGRLGIVDSDTVELSNLQRQVLHATADIGKSKVRSAQVRLHQANPTIEIVPFETRLTSENALHILRSFDVVLDGSDNFPTRYLLNDACVFLQKPYVYGSIFRFEGQVSVFDPRRGPCYRCLFPQPPPPHMVPNCAEGGVLGVLPGIVGSLQAAEVLKLLLGIGEPLIGKLLFLDLLRAEVQTFTVRKDEKCPLCGTNRTVTRLLDYDEFCGVKHRLDERFDEISPRQLYERLTRGDEIAIVDVREPYEYEIANIGGLLIPLRELPSKLELLDPAEEIVVVCHHGNRSGAAVEFLKKKGFTNVKNLVGGVDRWAREIDPQMPRY